MNKSKIKSLYRKLDEEVKDIPWLRYGPIKELAVRAWVLRMRLSTENTKVFKQMKEECQPIAKAIGKSWTTVMAFNCVYDLAMHDIPLELGCTVGSVGPYWLRVLDWQIPEGIGKHTVKSTLKAEDGTRLTVVGFPGFVGLQ